MLNMYQFLLIMDLILAKIPSRDAFPSDISNIHASISGIKTKDYRIIVFYELILFLFQH